MSLRISIGWLKIGSDDGISWTSWWNHLISATVENAAPTHVVLTFPSAKPSLGASDFTITGFTISSASWTGAVLTLVLSTAVTVYSGNLTITFVKTGTTAVVTNNVTMVHTVGWYVSGDGSATYVTKDGSDFVSVLKDLSGANHPLNQATGTNQPLWSANGILFDGIDNYLKTAAFTFDQPEMIYMVIKQLTWTVNDYLFDGLTVDTGIVYDYGVTPILRAYAGTDSVSNDKLALNTWGIMRVLFKGATSKFIINNTTPVTGNFGAGNMSGFTLGGSGHTPPTGYSNIQVKEIILRNVEDSTSDETLIYNYLATKYGFTTI